MMKRVLALSVVLMLAVMLAGCQAAAQGMEPENEKPEESQERMIEAFGVVKCRENLNMLVNFPLTVEAVFAREGQVVQKGDVLAQVNADELQLQIELKKLQLEGERRILARLEQETGDKKELLSSGQDPDILKLNHDLENARENYNKLLTSLHRRRTVAAGSMTQNEVDLFQKSVDAAKKAIEDIDFSLNSIQYGRKVAISELESQIMAKKNGITLAQRELEQMIKKTKSQYITDGNIVCTMDKAIVDGVFVTNGDMTAASMKLFSLIDLNTQYIEARVLEEFIKDVKVGMEARVIPLADKSVNYSGTVKSIAQKAQQRNGETNVLVEIELKDADGFLIPDLNVNV